MDPKDKLRIQKNTIAIVDDLQVDDIIPKLIQDGTLTLNDSEIIRHEITKQRQALKLIEVITSRGPGAYNSFRKSLLESYEHLVSQLDHTEVSPGDVSLAKSSLSRKSSSDGFLRLIQEELKTQYLAELNCIVPVPWLECFQVDLEKVYTALQIVRGVNRKTFHRAVFQEQGHDYTVGTRDIFKSNDECANPRRVLVEGEPGIGKSTMCCKLCYDWAREGSSTEHSVHQFELIFILKARELNLRTTITDSIYTQLFPEDFAVTKAEFKECITRNAKKILIIVDGYDEIMEQHSDLNKLLQAKVLSQVAILLTSRPGYAVNLMKYFDSVFINIGYDVKRRLEFIDKFSSETSSEDEASSFTEFKNRIEADGVLSELCRNPLNLSILCMLVGETNLDLPKTRTALYEELQDFITHRASLTLGVGHESLVEKARSLERIAYEGLRRGDHQVKESEVSMFCDVKTLQHLGFFCKEVSISRFKKDTVYTFTHKSFMEFFAAKFLAKQKRTRQERKDMAYEMIQNGQSGLVIVFLCGLLKDQTESLLDIFDIVKLETFLPSVPCEELGIHDVNENHRGHMIFHCLNEITPLPKKLGPRLMNLLVDQVSVSYPWCSEECLDGLLKFCDLTDVHCKWCNMLNDLRTSLQQTTITSQKPEEQQEQKVEQKQHQQPDILNSFPMSKSRPRRAVAPKPKPKPPRPSSLKGISTSGENRMDNNTESKLKNVVKQAWEAKGSGGEDNNKGTRIVVSPMSTQALKDLANTQRRQSSPSWIHSSKSPRTKSLDVLDERDVGVDYNNGVDYDDDEDGMSLSDSRRRTKSSELKKYNVHDIPLSTRKLQASSTSVNDHSFESREAFHQKQVNRRRMCNKIGVTVPGQFATERGTLFHKLVSNLIGKRHVSAFGMHNITAVAEVQALLKTLGSCGGCPRMTALKLKFTGGLTDMENNNVIRLDPLFLHWVQSLTVIECSSPKVLNLLLSALPKPNSLRSVSFVYCTFDEPTIGLLNNIIRHLKALKKFEFINNTLMTQDHLGIVSVFEALHDHTLLSEFSVSHLPMTPKLVNFKMKNEVTTPVSQDVALVSQDEMSLLFTPELCRIINHNHLQVLAISNTNLEEQMLGVIRTLVAGNSVLEGLKLRHCNVLSNSAFEALLKEIVGNRRLQKIDFEETELSLESMELLSEFLGHSNTKLVKLVLSMFNSGSVPMIARGLKANRTLTHLYLAKTSFTEDGMGLFSGAISSHPTLQHLSMSSNGLVPPNVSLLFNGVRASNSLQHLALNTFGLDDLHMIELSKVLAANENIIELDLQRNVISGVGADQLYKGLMYRSKLMKLLLNDNKVKEYDNEIKLLKTRVLYLRVNWF